MTRSFPSRAFVLLMSMGCLAGCKGESQVQLGDIVGGSTRQVRDVTPVGGFLPAPELLQVGGSTNAALFYRDADVDLTSYTSLILEPVTLWTGPESPVASVPRAQRTALANDFTSDLYQALKTKCRMTQRAGPETARIRIALVDATATNAVVNTVATYAPYVSTAYSLASIGFNQRVGVFAGTATMEGVATDSLRGTVLWQAVDKRGGTTALVKDTLDSQLDVHLAFKAWSEKLLVGLQQLGICTR